jgi:hypothetical protein
MFVSLHIFVGALELFLCINNAAVSSDLKPRVRSQRVLSKGKQSSFLVAFKHSAGLKRVLQALSWRVSRIFRNKKYWLALISRGFFKACNFLTDFFAQIRSLLIPIVLNRNNGEPAIWESENCKYLTWVNSIPSLVTRGYASFCTLVTIVGYCLHSHEWRYFTILGFSDGRIMIILVYGSI